MTSKDATFTNFTPEQAAAYASARGTSYPRPLYEHILGYHSGDNGTIFDIGTGPGQVVFDLLGHFKRGLGIDTGAEMIEQAKNAAKDLGVSERTSFAVCGGETCADAFPDEKVDLVTVAMAAHWFDLEAFYRSAAKTLKPGGTLAIWTCSSQYVHPSAFNAKEIQQALFDLEDHMLGPFRTPGNVLSRNGYRDLDLPWNFASTNDLFVSSTLERKDWDLNGIPTAPPLEDGTPGPFLWDRGETSTVEKFIDQVGSAGMVIRWREANPLKAYGDEDPVLITAKRLRKLIDGAETLSLSPSVSLILMRRA